MLDNATTMAGRIARRFTGRRVIGAVGVAALAMVAGSAGALAQGLGSGQGGGDRALSEFAGCIAGSKSGDILLVMDESGSLAGTDTITATDPDAKRVDAAQAFVKKMADYADATGSDINVRLAGFGGDYNAATDWTALESDDEGTNVDDDIEAFADRANENWTDYSAGLAGAAAAFRDSESPCRTVLFFSDGKPTAEGAADDSAIMDQVCHADGPVGRLRASGIQVFTIGLSNGDDDPAEHLRRISEGTDCSALAPNGAYIPAADASALTAAFEKMAPSLGLGYDESRGIDESVEFTLDDSVTPVQLSVTPTGSGLDDIGALIPVLTPPGGEPIDLTGDVSDIAGNPITVTEGNEDAKGSVKVNMERGGDEWAGNWTFGYRVEGGQSDDAGYEFKLDIIPGLSIVVADSQPNVPLAKSDDDVIGVSIVGPDGDQRRFDGDARFTARIEPSNGDAPITLVDNEDIRSGSLDVPLDKVNGAVAGNLRMELAVTTAGDEGRPGTQLKPLHFSKDISVAPATMPKLPGSVNLDVHGTDGTATMQVAGPGTVWVDPGSFTVGDATVEYTADHDESNPLELERGETGEIVLTATTGTAIDRAIADAWIPVTAVDAESGQQDTVDVRVEGALTAPIDKATFGVALVLALLLALLIPLGVLYLMKYLTGRIPSSPGIHAVRVPVTLDGTTVVRTDKGGEFDLTYEEVIAAPRVTSSGRSVTLAGEQVVVKTGLNPFEPPKAVAESPNSISDAGERSGGSAQLPLAVHDRWFAIAQTPAPSTGMQDPMGQLGQMPGAPGKDAPIRASLIVAADEGITRERLAAIVDDIRRNGADRLGRLRETMSTEGSADGGPAESPTTDKESKRAKDKRGRRAAGAGDGRNQSPQPQPSPQNDFPSDFGSGDSFGGGSAGSGFGSNSGFGAGPGSTPDANRDSGFGQGSGFGSGGGSGFGGNAGSGFGTGGGSGFGGNPGSGFGAGGDSGFGANPGSSSGFDGSSGFGANRGSGFGRPNQGGFGQGPDSGSGSGRAEWGVPDDGAGNPPGDLDR
ncbi:vWA domain-containing protein [Corynebacterium freneyi]|uniref:vWA domain-containing protein n=1 Tax=Corynebacterium freneyi TaxID=134034 RepID=UPI0023B80692|nr:vWA domain-containing protein [Corynebacterium freneyi]